MAEVNIKVLDNGPYVVAGEITLMDVDGKPFETKEGIALCRCGHSENKPFCDGTHKKTGFQSAVKAP